MTHDNLDMEVLNKVFGKGPERTLRSVSCRSGARCFSVQLVALLMLLVWTASGVVNAQLAPAPTSVITAAVLKDFPPLYTRDKARRIRD